MTVNTVYLLVDLVGLLQSDWVIWMQGFTWLVGLWISTCWKPGCGVEAALVLLLVPSPMDSSLWSMIMSVSESSSMWDLPCVPTHHLLSAFLTFPSILHSCSKWTMGDYIGLDKRWMQQRIFKKKLSNRNTVMW